MIEENVASNEDKNSPIKAEILEAELNRQHNGQHFPSGQELAFPGNAPANSVQSENLPTKVPSDNIISNSTSKSSRLHSLNLNEFIDNKSSPDTLQSVPFSQFDDQSSVKDDTKIDLPATIQRLDDQASIPKVQVLGSGNEIPRNQVVLGIQRKIEDTTVNCQNEFMTVTFK